MKDSTGEARASGADTPRWSIGAVIDRLGEPGRVISSGGREPLAAVSRLRWAPLLFTFSVADRFNERGAVCDIWRMEAGLGERAGRAIERGDNAWGVGVCALRKDSTGDLGNATLDAANGEGVLGGGGVGAGAGVGAGEDNVGQTCVSSSSNFNGLEQVAHLIVF